MFEDLTDLHIDEFRGILGKRLIFKARDPLVYCSNRRIKFSIDLLENAQQRLTPKSDLVFENCLFEEDVLMRNAATDGQVTFNQCLFLKAVKLDTLENITLQGYIDFATDLIVNVNGKEKLENVVVRKALTVFSMRDSASVLSIQNINKDSPFERAQLMIKGGGFPIYLFSNRFEQVSIDLEMPDKVTIIDCQIHTLEMMTARPSRLFLDGCFIDQFDLDKVGAEGGVVELIRSRINSFYSLGDQFLRLYMSELTIGSAVFMGIIDKDRNVIISNSTLNSLSFENMYNNGSFSFQNLILSNPGLLKMSRSTLGKMDFISCSFEKAKLIFENSKLTEIFVANTALPSKVEDDNGINHSQARLAFGQIRTAFEKQGDTVHALEYQSREIEAHYKEIKSFWRSEAPWIHFTKLNLGLNKLSNDFGRDWGRGILFSLLIGLLCFFFLLWTTSTYSIVGTWKREPALAIAFFVS